jgi:DivIVA domain-containing protein
MKKKHMVILDSNSGAQSSTITATDVLQQNFATKFRGYDTRDVDAFLQAVAGEISRLTHENARLFDELILLRRQLGQFRKRGAAGLPANPGAGQQTAGDAQDAAAKDAERILADARSESERMLSESRLLLDLQYEEIQKLSAMADSDTGALVAGAREEAERILTDARQRVSDLLDDAKKRAAEVPAGTADDPADSRAEAEKIIDDARRESERIMAEAQSRIHENYDLALLARENAEKEALDILEHAREESRRIIDEGRLQIAEFTAQAAQQKDAAQIEAEKLMEDARADIELMRREIEREREGIQDELQDLNRRKTEFQTSLKALLETYRKLLDNDE